tara:strand:+ start:194 stop:391 length:198 start_codon:yes stop_codon:yes gene_type:complete
VVLVVLVTLKMVAQVAAEVSLQLQQAAALLLLSLVLVLAAVAVALVKDSVVTTEDQIILLMLFKM